MPEIERVPWGWGWDSLVKRTRVLVVPLRLFSLKLGAFAVLFNFRVLSENKIAHQICVRFTIIDAS